MKIKKTLLNPWGALFILYILAVILRVWFVKDGAFPFGFDQARDAVYANQILDGDLKLFGPTASGTKDTVFHGVIYYYFLATLHIISDDPIIISIIISCLTALSIIPAFFISKKIFKNSLFSLLVPFFITFSFNQVTSGSWLSNPSIIILLLPFFIYFFISLTENFSNKNMILTMLTLGLSTQFLLFEIYWIIPLIIFLFHQLHQNNWKLKYNEIKIWILGLLTLTISVSSMLFAEFLMIKRGILTLEILEQFNSGRSSNIPQLLQSIFSLWLNKVKSSLSINSNSIFIIILILFFYFLKNKTYFKQKLKFFNVIFLTPLLFFLIYFRNNTHMLIGYEIIIYLYLAIFLFLINLKIKNKYIMTILVFLISIFFMYNNIINLQEIKRSRNNPNSVQKGFVYQDQIDLVYKTYQIADGRKFSFSSLTNPYRVNVTWAYLYNYIFRYKNKTKPFFWGSDQTGWVGDDLLQTVSQPKELHFSIIEADIGLSKLYIDQFYEEQLGISNRVPKRYKFGEIELLVFDKKNE